MRWSDDEFEAGLSNWGTVNVCCIVYIFPNLTDLQFLGGAGSDTATLTGSAAGETGNDPEAGRRGAPIGHSHHT